MSKNQPLKIDATKPCDDCTRNIEEAILYDEVSCFLTCKDFQTWREKETQDDKH